MSEIKRYDPDISGSGHYSLPTMDFRDDGDWVSYEAHLAALPQWRTMDTAPKDGTPVLMTGGVMKDYRGYDEDRVPVVARFSEDAAYGEEGWIVGWYDGRFGTVVYENPTHWMFVPEVTP